ncbi:MAG: HDIG domain-containing protein, partial [Candidatus Omnitrophica bacterium]|nr:HDIG domain-containing protein [Candidatus Omnitrophota bacterium]
NKIKFLFAIVSIFVISYFLQLDLIIPLYLAAFFVYLLYRSPALKDIRILHLILLFLIMFVAGYFVIRQKWSVFFIPFSLIPMLATILFGDLETSLLISLAGSLSIASIANNNYLLGILSLTSGVLGGVLVWGARRRMAVIRAGFLVGFLQIVTLIFMERFHLQGGGRYVILFFNGIISSITVLGVLPVFEYLFKRVTNISLLEMADFHHPLLQQMMTAAAGTYHHSLVVGNLSEAACQAIGANALLARVGAYYHDIGKLTKPEYFSENQNITESKHSNLSPSMSKLVIMNHVKEGLELAKRYRLNPLLIDFIQQHHGTSLVYYFYRRALETLEDDEEIREEGFRYPGPKASTRETAVVLLADSTEAAARAIKEPNPTKIEELVHKIINNKFIDGQLDECDLTLKDLEKISSVFIHILGGIYHSRVTYPENTVVE